MLWKHLNEAHIMSTQNRENSGKIRLDIPCEPFLTYSLQQWPRWLSWMRRPPGDQEVAGSTPAEVGNILS